MNYLFDTKKSTPLCEIMGRHKSDKGSINIEYSCTYFKIKRL